MPTLPLYQTPADPNASHRVIAPGGYERWRFDVEDQARGLRVIVDFIEGADSDTDYLTRYHRYRRRPTRVPPPQAREYPCVHYAVYEHGHLLSAEAVQGRPEDFTASDEQPDVRVATSGFRREDDGALHVELRQGRCSADVVFRPLFRHAPLQRSLLPATIPGGCHQWIVSQPLCRVDGCVRVTAGGELREATVKGLGCHDHHFGTSPLGVSVVRRLWGRLLTADRTLMFHAVTPVSGGGDEVQVIESDAAGSRALSVAAWNPDWSRRGRGVVYPATIALGDRLRLSNPHLLDSDPDQLRIEYDAEGEGPRRTAFCEVDRPPVRETMRGSI